MTDSVDEIVNAPQPGVDEALDPSQQPSAEAPMSFDEAMGHADRILQNLIHGGADQQQTAENATQNFYQSFNRGTPGSIAERWNPNNYGSIARRDAFDLGNGDPMKEKVLIARDVNAPSEVFAQMTGSKAPRVDLRFTNFPKAPAAIRARSVSPRVLGQYAVPPPNAARREITQTKYPALPQPRL